MLQTCINPNLKRDTIVLLDSYGGFNFAAEAEDEDEDNTESNSK